MIEGTRARIDRAIAQTTTISARIANAQTDVATGLRVRRASDDPRAADAAAALRSTATLRTAWVANADQARALGQAADGVMGSAQTALDRARELMIVAQNATLSPADRASIATEIASIADDIDALAATRTADGGALFDADPRLIPIGESIRIAPTPTRIEAFGDASAQLRGAAATLSGTDAERAAGLSAVAAAGDAMATARGNLGVRTARIAAVRERMVDTGVVDAETLAGLVETDVAATIARIQADQLTLDASRGLFARVNARTLFDMLG